MAASTIAISPSAPSAPPPHGTISPTLSTRHSPAVSQRGPAHPPSAAPSSHGFSTRNATRHAHSVARLSDRYRISNSHLSPDPREACKYREGRPAHLVAPYRAHPLQQLHHLPTSRRRRPIQPAYLRRRAPLVGANPHRHAIALHAALAARARLRRLRRQSPALP